MPRANAISDQLREAIVQSGKSFGAIGTESGVDSGRISRFMRGERSLTLSAVDDLSRYFGLELRPIKRTRRNRGKST